MINDQGQYYYKAAKTYYDLGELQMAEEYFMKAKEVVEATDDIFFLLKILGFLIRISSEAMYKHLTDRYILESEKALNQALKLYPTQGAEYYYNFGQIHTYKKDFSSAGECFSICTKKALDLADNEMLAKGYYALSQNAYSLDNYELSLQFIIKMKKIPGFLGPYLRGVLHLQLANIYLATNKSKEGLTEVKYSRLAFQGRPCWNLLPYIFLTEGLLFKKMEQYNRALYIFNLGLDLLNRKYYQRSYTYFRKEIEYIQNSNVDMYLNRSNRVVKEKILGNIDFKHRFVILEILYLLASAPNKSFNKADLAKLIWKNEYSPRIHDQLVYTSVSRLRKLLAPKDCDSKRQYILRNQDGYTINTSLNIRVVKESDAQDNFDFNHINPIAPI